MAAAAGKATERLGQGDGLPVLRVHSLGALEARTRLEQQVSELLLELASFTAKLGGERSRAEALELARRVLEVDPCYQEAHPLATQLFLESNRPQEAVRQFEQCKRALRQGLGMEPSIEVIQVHQRALLSL